MASAEFQNMLTMFRAMADQPMVEISVEEQRARYDSIGSMFPVPDDVTVQEITAGGVTCEWITTAESESDRVIFYVHGGGYVIGSIKGYREFAGRLSRAARARVLNVEYRLAPEHPHPAAVDDSMAAYRWVLDQGVDPAKMIIAGDSAGGGLTVATLLALKDAGLPLPACAVCLSPWVDLTQSGESMKTRGELDPLVSESMLGQMADHYLQGRNATTTPLASPLFGDLSGLPPLLIQVGTSEVLYDDSVRLAESVNAAGGKATLEPWDEMVHIFQLFAPMLPEGQQAIERIGEFALQHTK